MITHDQILPSLYHLQRLGHVGSIRICALNSAPLRALAEEPKFAEAFPGQTFQPFPALEEPPERVFPDLYREVIAAPAAAQTGRRRRARPFARAGDPRGAGARPARAGRQAAGAQVRPVGRDRAPGSRHGAVRGRRVPQAIRPPGAWTRGASTAAAGSASSAAAKPSWSSLTTTATRTSRTGSRRRTATRSPTSAATTWTWSGSSPACGRSRSRSAASRGSSPTATSAISGRSARSSGRTGPC